jgi:hypothetical protein
MRRDKPKRVSPEANGRFEPVRLNSASQLMAAVAKSLKTVNNRLVLEWGSWQRRLRQFECVPKTSIFGGLAVTKVMYHGYFCTIAGRKRKI